MNGAATRCHRAGGSAQATQAMAGPMFCRRPRLLLKALCSVGSFACAHLAERESIFYRNHRHVYVPTQCSYVRMRVHMLSKVE